MGGSPEETELSITLTLRMLMHGKVMVGGLGAAQGGQQCLGWGAMLEKQLLAVPCFPPLLPIPLGTEFPEGFLPPC